MVRIQLFSVIMYINISMIRSFLKGGAGEHYVISIFVS